MIYLDNSATTALDEETLEAMLPWLREGYGNASSIYLLGRKARVRIEEAREEIAHLINAHPAEIVFTSGGTESNNAVLKSCLDESHLATSLAVSSVEHHAILHPAEELQRRGFPVTYLPVDTEGRIAEQELYEVVREGVLLSLMHGNNEVGTLQPIATLRESLPEGVLFHTDAVQTLGKVPFDVQELGVDFATFSAHKLHGPKGIGALYVRRGLDFKAHQQGGAQERNRRGGTEAVALIAGFHIAMKKACVALEERTATMRLRIVQLRNLLRNIPNIRVNTPEDGALPHILNVSFPQETNLDGEALIQAMDINGIAVSNGSACVSGSLQPSHVLLAMGRDKHEAACAVRFSVSYRTTEDEIETAAAALAATVESIRENSI